MQRRARGPIATRKEARASLRRGARESSHLRATLRHEPGVRRLRARAGPWPYPRPSRRRDQNSPLSAQSPSCVSSVEWSDVKTTLSSRKSMAHVNPEFPSSVGQWQTVRRKKPVVESTPISEEQIETFWSLVFSASARVPSLSAAAPWSPCPRGGAEGLQTFNEWCDTRGIEYDREDVACRACSATPRTAARAMAFRRRSPASSPPSPLTSLVSLHPIVPARSGA